MNRNVVQKSKEMENIRKRLRNMEDRDRSSLFSKKSLKNVKVFQKMRKKENGMDCSKNNKSEI